MKFWALAGLLAGLVATTLILRKRNPEPIRVQTKTDQRYTVDDFMAEL